jgi:hypothetical protein
LGAIREKGALMEIAGVQAHDLAACVDEVWDENRADVAIVAGYEHAFR